MEAKYTHTYGTHETWRAHNMSEELLSLIQLQIIIVVPDSHISPKCETTNNLLLDGV